MEPKRRLPLLPSAPPAEDPADAPPPSHWVGFGTAAIFATWLPLAYGAEWVKGRLVAPYVRGAASPEDARRVLEAADGATRGRLSLALLVLHVVPLLAAASAGGFLVGRWGGRAGVREAALSGAATALVVSLLTWATAGLSWVPLVAFVLLPPLSALGGRLGVRRRPPG